jgi:hypothetical protein
MNLIVSVWMWTAGSSFATRRAMVVLPLPGIPQKIRRRPLVLVGSRSLVEY